MRNDIKEFRGEWFLPASQNIKLPGILILNEKENIIKLRLISEIDITGNEIINKVENVIYCKIILGVTSIGDHITLYNYSGSEYGVPVEEYEVGGKLYELVYKPNLAFVGKHFETPESIVFNNYSFEYNFLDLWVKKVKNFQRSNNETNTIITIPSVPETIVKINEDCEMRIVKDLYSKNWNFRKSYFLEVQHFVSFSFKNTVPLNEYFKLSASFRSFLTFSVGYPISTKGEFSLNNEGCLRIFCAQKDKDIDNESLFSGMFFSYEDIIDENISSWFEVYNTFHRAIDIFIHAVTPLWKKGSRIFSHIQYTNGLLNVCQAIETFYNRDNKIDYLLIRKDLNMLKQKGLDKIIKNKKVLKFTDQELNFYKKHYKVPKERSEVSYKHKILYYLKDLEVALDCFIGKSEFETFATQLKDCRNDLTHVNYDENTGGDFDLTSLFNYAQILFYAMVTKQIGLDQRLINNSMKNSNQFGVFYKTDQ